MMGGEGPRTLAIMWALTALVFVFLILRFFTRICIVRSVGIDDHMYFWSWEQLCLFLHNLFVHVAGNYGFGQDQRTLPYDDGVTAHMWETVGQTFIILGMGIGKMSLALFLLRIVIVRWHRIAVWAVGGSLCFASCLTAILCWFQCVPVQRIFDPRVKGHCIIDPVPWAILLGAFCIFVDFFFAVFPWMFLYGLEMKRKEKMIVGCSLSIGIIAGISGIIRTINLTGLGSANYTGDTIRLVVWSAAELAITLVCIAIPCIIPLYTRMEKSSFGSSNLSSSRRYQKHSHGTSDGHPDLELVPRQAGLSHASEQDERNTAINGPFTEIQIYTNDANYSDEAILYDGSNKGRKKSAIIVREEVSVSSSSAI